MSGTSAMILVERVGGMLNNLGLLAAEMGLLDKVRRPHGYKGSGTLIFLFFNFISRPFSQPLPDVRGCRRVFTSGQIVTGGHPEIFTVTKLLSQLRIYVYTFLRDGVATLFILFLLLSQWR